MNMKSEVNYHFIQLADELSGVDLDEAKSVVGERIRRGRKAAGLTAKELGEKLEPPVTQSGISSWERGRTTPSADMRDQLERLFSNWRDEIDRDDSLVFCYIVEMDTSPKRKEAKDKLLRTIKGLSVEGIERLTEYAEFLSQKYPSVKTTNEEKGKEQK